MLSNALKALFAGLFAWILTKVQGKESERVQADEQKTIDQKTVEAQATLDDLDKLGALKTTAAAGVKDQEAKVAEDEAAVADAKAKVDEAVESAKTIVPPVHDVTGEELEAKLTDL